MEKETVDELRVRQLLGSNGQPPGRKKLTKAVMRRARSRAGQRDVMVFALVKIWAAFAKVVAPFFAFLGAKQAEAGRQGSSKKIDGTLPNES